MAGGVGGTSEKFQAFSGPDMGLPVTGPHLKSLAQPNQAGFGLAFLFQDNPQGISGRRIGGPLLHGGMEDGEDLGGWSEPEYRNFERSLGITVRRIKPQGLQQIPNGFFIAPGARLRCTEIEINRGVA